MVMTLIGQVMIIQICTDRTVDVVVVVVDVDLVVVDGELSVYATVHCVSAFFVGYFDVDY